MRKVLQSVIIGAVLLSLLVAITSCTGKAKPTPTPTPQSQVELVLRADLANITSPDEAMAEAIQIIKSRLAAYDVIDASVTTLDMNTILVQLPGLKALVTEVGALDFREQLYDSSGKPVLDENGYPKWIQATAIDDTGKEVPLTGIYLKKNAEAVLEQNTNNAEVVFEFNDEGSILFAQITGRLIGKPLGIFLDNQLIYSPTVRAQIEGGNGVIGNLSLDDATVLTILLNSGALPLPLELISTHP
jgi:preprotein translocase subunit SecD